jgi:hypothetical protein
MSRVVLLVIAATGLLAAALLLWKVLQPQQPPPATQAVPTAASVPPAASVAAASPVQPVGSEQPRDDAWLADMTERSGIRFVHHSGDSAEKPFPSANGSGLAACDYDLDGQMDLIFATGNDFPVQVTAESKQNRCFRNLGGWSFIETTGQTGLDHRGYTHGVAVADVDSDGFPDVLFTGYGPDVLFHNRGDGTFEQMPAGIEDTRWSSSAAFFDADLDGLLDLYVCHYGSWSLDDNPFCGDASGNVRVFCSPLTVEPVPDAFFRNQGDGRFIDSSETAGILVPPGRGLAVLAAQLDDDHAIDLYVANDLNHNVFLTGGTNGQFTDRSDLSGAAYDSLGRVKSSMGIDAADTRGTGRFDLLVTDFQREYNLLFANAGGGMFVDASEGSGVGPASVQLVSWGVQFADMDLDGREDAIVTSGHVGDERDPGADLRQPGLILRNTGTRFETLTAGQAGSYFSSPHQGRGLIAADLDNDGDEDFAFNHRDEPASLLANEVANRAAPARRSLTLKLVGTRSNRDAIGSVVTLAASPPQLRQIKGGGGYQSTRDPRLFFAVDGERTASLTIRWPTGMTSTLDGLTSGGSYLVIEPKADEPARLLLMEEPTQ